MAQVLNPPRHSAQVNNFGPTPSQTVGPYFAYGLTAQQYGYDFSQIFTSTIAESYAEGQHIHIEGQVLDGDGKPIPDAIVEFTHADANGKYPASREAAKAQGFYSVGRCGTGTDTQNRYHFQTILPGAESEGQAPHIHVCITMRGLLLHAHTRLYFAGHPANANDAVLNASPEDRRSTLLAKESSPGVWTLDFCMQAGLGKPETVFFDL